jgi:hypothetical protein
MEQLVSVHLGRLPFVMSYDDSVKRCKPQQADDSFACGTFATRLSVPTIFRQAALERHFMPMV